MLQVGDQVVYPMHGAGVIADIEQCEVMGEVKSYYVLKMPIGSMKVMIPTDNVENIGLRDVISKKGVKKVAEVLADTPERAVGSWNKRFHATLARMKSGGPQPDPAGSGPQDFQRGASAAGSGQADIGQRARLCLRQRAGRGRRMDGRDSGKERF